MQSVSRPEAFRNLMDSLHDVSSCVCPEYGKISARVVVGGVAFNYIRNYRSGIELFFDSLSFFFFRVHPFYRNAESYIHILGQT